jgi:hypothetical protein
VTRATPKRLAARDAVRHTTETIGGMVLSALMMMRRLAQALRVALRDEDFGRVLTAGLALIVIGTLTYSLGAGWSLVDSL